MRIGNTYYTDARFVIKCPSNSFDSVEIEYIDERSSDAECSLLNFIKRALAHGSTAEVLQFIVKVPLISAIKLFNTSQ